MRRGPEAAAREAGEHVAPLCLPGRTPGRRRRPRSPRAQGRLRAGAALRRLARVAGAARRMCCLTLRPPLGSRSSGSQHLLSSREPGTDSSSKHPSPRPGPRPPRPAPLQPSALGSLSAPPGLSRRGWRRPRLGANRDLRRSILDSPKLLQTEESSVGGVPADGAGGTTFPPL